MIATVGVIRNREQARVLKSFEGLNYNAGITPTDIDGSVDILGRLFVLFEFKRFGCVMPRGQALHLERVCSAINDGGKKCIVIEAWHNASGDKDIPCAQCQVSRWFDGKQWSKPEERTSVVALVNRHVRETLHAQGINVPLPAEA